jgi:putative transposase
MRIILLPIGEILAYCLMPNHYHILLKLNQISLSAAMQRLALSYVVPYNNTYGRSGHLFQGRFQAKHVTDIQYLVHLSRYIHLNPKTANLVKNAEDWNYSSLLEYYGIRSNQMVNTEIILDILTDTEKISLQEKQKRYRKFMDFWDPAYMEFRLK